MNTARTGSDDLPTESAEADLAEQSMPVTDEGTEPIPSPLPLECDAADASEQQQAVPTDEDEYRR